MRILSNYFHQLKHTWKYKQDPEVVPPNTSWASSVWYWWQHHATLWEIRNAERWRREQL